jgi:hypothetical protein
MYDVPTSTTTWIPARELAPGMVRVQVQGVEGDRWVNPYHLNKSSYQYGPFDEETRDDIRQIKASLDEVHLMSLDEWEDGFRRDLDAEQEIAIWLHLAKLYRGFTAGITDDLGEKRVSV